MNFGELCSEVMVLTNRPDLVAETQLAVRAATLRLHGLDTWFQDLQERQINFPAASYTFQLRTNVEFTNFRKIEYIKKFDPVGLVVIGDEVKFCSPMNLKDEFKRDKTDIYYVAGTNLNIRTKEYVQSFIAGWYSYPNVVNQYSSWIAEMFPYAIIEEAAGRLLHIIGMVEEGNKFVDPQKGSVALIHVPILKANGLTPEA